MQTEGIVDNVKAGIQGARQRLGTIVEQGQEVAATGVRTLRSARDIVAGSAQALARSQAEARRAIAEAARSSYEKVKGDAASVAASTRDELVRTFREGAEVIATRLSGVPSHKLEAAHRKAEVKAKKARKRAEAETIEIATA